MALAVETDSLMSSFFSMVLHGENVSNHEYKIDERYVKVYGDFYDILFVSKSGKVEHSIKKETDFHENLFSPPFNRTLLGKSLSAISEKQFIEFEFYKPSKEPAAFFVVPYKEKDKTLGWYVFQLASNSLNAALSDRQKLGRTGETYLVNRNNKMLTDSRFFKNSSTLTQDVTTEAVRLARQLGKGEKIISDYRDSPVFSSFQQVEVFGSEWILIVEVDEEEVLTDYYRDNYPDLLSEMLDKSFASQRQHFKKPIHHSFSEKTRR